MTRSERSGKHHSPFFIKTAHGASLLRPAGMTFFLAITAAREAAPAP